MTPQITEAYVYDRAVPDSITRIWPLPQHFPEGLIQEGRAYTIELRGEQLATVDLVIDGVPALALRSRNPSIGNWLWQPGFYAGNVELESRQNGRRIWRASIVIDPDTYKLTRGQFDQMVLDILSDTFALFAISSARKAIGRGVGDRVPPIARLEFLKSKFEAIEAAVQEITNGPVRILRSEEQRTRWDCGRRMTGMDLMRSFRLESVVPLPAGNRLFARFPQGLPSRARVQTRSTSLDISEHRAIKSRLRIWVGWLRVVSMQLTKASDGDEPQDLVKLRRQWVLRCTAMVRRLQALLDLPLFANVPDTTTRLTLSPIFRWKPAYNKFFRLSTDFDAGLARVYGDFLEMPLARTFDLYELWAFIRIAKAAVMLFGTEPKEIAGLFERTGADNVTIRSGSVCLKVREDLLLCFKKTFREFWLTSPPQIGSFSRRMIPDLSLSSQKNKRANTVVLDAKYRVDEQLSDAISSLHTYRDAIVQIEEDGVTKQVVTAAYVITPHLPPIDIVQQRHPWQSYVVPAVLFHPAYRTQFRFGAITLRPGASDADIIDLLKQLLTDAHIRIETNPASDAD